MTRISFLIRIVGGWVNTKKVKITVEGRTQRTIAKCIKFYVQFVFPFSNYSHNIKYLLLIIQARGAHKKHIHWFLCTSLFLTLVSTIIILIIRDGSFFSNAFCLAFKWNSSISYSYFRLLFKFVALICVYVLFNRKMLR